MTQTVIDRQSEYKALLWATRRGMLELDVILTPYLEHAFNNMSASDIKHFKEYLEQDDPDLYAWLMGFESPLKRFDSITLKIRKYIEQQLT